MTRSEILAKVRTYIDTPFHFQGALKGVGIDCIHLVTNILEHYKIAYDLPNGYKLIPKKGLMKERLADALNPVEEPRPGTIILMWHSLFNYDSHVAWYGEDSLIHTYVQAGKVVEQAISDMWRQRFMGFYDLPGVE